MPRAPWSSILILKSDVPALDSMMMMNKTSYDDGHFFFSPSALLLSLAPNQICRLRHAFNIERIKRIYLAKHSLMDCSYSFDDFCNFNAHMSTSSLTCRLQASETSPHEFLAVFDRFFEILSKAGSQQVSTPFHLFHLLHEFLAVFNRFFEILSKASSQQVSTPFHLFFQLCTKSCCAVRKGMLFFCSVCRILPFPNAGRILTPSKSVLICSPLRTKITLARCHCQY